MNIVLRDQSQLFLSEKQLQHFPSLICFYENEKRLQKSTTDNGKVFHELITDFAPEAFRDLLNLYDNPIELCREQFTELYVLEKDCIGYFSELFVLHCFCGSEREDVESLLSKVLEKLLSCAETDKVKRCLNAEPLQNVGKRKPYRVKEFCKKRKVKK